MKDRIGLLYSTVSSATRYVAEMIKVELGAERVDVINLANVTPDLLAQYDRLVIGAPTWDTAAADATVKAFLTKLEHLDLTGKQVALFGLGDQVRYPGKFLDTLGLIYRQVQRRGAKVVGRWPTEGYEFRQSLAVDNGSFVGLALDEDNQSERTIDRIELWSEMVRLAFDADSLPN